MSNQRVLYWPETYNNIKELGRGVSGVVYKASHKKTGQIVAIKLVDMKQSKISTEQIQGEIRALLTLNPENERSHINIIKLIQCFIHKTTAIFILEYVDGGTLEDFMYSFERGMPLPLISHCLYQAVNAIEYMNSKKCSHRDIKPANILMMRNRKPKQLQEQQQQEGGYIRYSGQFQPESSQENNNYQFDPDELPILKVTDYGYASIGGNDSTEIHSTLAGSPLYMAPEIIHIILSPFLEPGTGKLSADSPEGYNPLLVDVWAIGAVAFRLITGDDLISVIFPNLNQATVLAALVNLAKMIDNGDFQKGLNSIPNEIRKYGLVDPDIELGISFISALLQLDPKKRLPLKETLNHPFLAKGKISFTQTLNQHYKDNKDVLNSIIPSDISNFLNNNNQQQQQQQQQKSFSTSSLPQVDQQQNNEKDQSNSSSSSSSSPPSPTISKSSPSSLSSSLSPSSSTDDLPKAMKWSSSVKPPKKSNFTPTFLSHQRSDKISLFPKLLPPPTKDTPPLETMNWRSPPIEVGDSITWTTLTQDAIFQVQFSVLTSFLKVISATNSYQFRIITSLTKVPLEIAVSNHKDTILYMYNIVKTVIAPQLISLSNAFDENSIRSVLAAILYQIGTETEQAEIANGWTLV
ncbi:hypothetical protein RB653_005230 [Dictyostelium firmibasis]|uniref:Protein kinase domain-containing protein n=1 Tax=Dictyostelium firmibasis TaxID=79012 RepID=A0AAN7U7E1_9MYCE